MTTCILKYIKQNNPTLTPQPTKISKSDVKKDTTNHLNQKNKMVCLTICTFNTKVKTVKDYQPNNILKRSNDNWVI